MKFLSNFKESGIVVASIFLFVGFFSLLGIIPFDSTIALAFLIGGILVVLGQGIFLFGAKFSLIEMGKKVGANLIKVKSIFIILFIGFLFGFVGTIAEPDVNLFVSQILSFDARFPSIVWLTIIGLGVGAFIVLGLIRVIKKIPIKYILTICYAIIAILVFFVPNTLASISFDTSGVTTGPITSPFFLSLVIGFSAMKMNKKSGEETFGILAIASMGSVLMMLIFGAIVGGSGTQAVYEITSETNFLTVLLSQCKEVLIVLAPVVIIFLICQFIYIKMRKRELLEMGFSCFIAYVGLVLFLTGINYGFTGMGQYIGTALANFSVLKGNYAFFVVFVAILGFLVSFTEPAINIFASQVEEVTNRDIRKNVILIVMGIGVCLATILSILKIIYGWDFKIIILGLILLAVILSFFVPEMFVSLAFDSGGVASGTMVAAFILPISIGASIVLGGSGADGFGIVGIVATVPIVCLEILGLIYDSQFLKMEIYQRNLFIKLSNYIDKSMKPSGKSAKKSAKVFEKEINYNENKTAKNSAEVFMKEENNE